MENISFKPFIKADLPLLLTWLSNPHVKAWWDQDVAWTMQLIEEKYGPYVDGYKEVNGSRKPLYAYIVIHDATPIGYIQMYNVHDFPREAVIDFSTLPTSCAALDFYIGNPDYLGKGLGVNILQLFLSHHVWPKYDACLVDPDKDNIAAIKTYIRAGFVEYTKTEKSAVLVAYRPES